MLELILSICLLVLFANKIHEYWNAYDTNFPIRIPIKGGIYNHISKIDSGEKNQSCTN